MKIYSIDTLQNFRSWSGASPVFYRMSTDEIEILENELECLYPDGLSETEINDILWFDTDWVLETIAVDPDEFWKRPYNAI